MHLRSGSIAQHISTKTKKGRNKARPANEGAGPEMATGADKSLEDSMKELISSLRGDLFQQFGELKQEVEKLSKDTRDLHKDVRDLRNDVSAIVAKHEEAEERIQGLEEREMLSQALLFNIIAEHRDMREKLDYLENKSRQNNIRIYQVKEGAEGADMVGFITRLISEKLGISAQDFMIVAAHRSLIKRPSSDATPRSMVVRFLQWDTRQKVLQAAWKKNDIRLEQTRIYFDRDYSVKLQQERARYGPIRRQLREKGVKSHIIYQAKLKVFTGDDITIYQTPEDATEQLEAKGCLQGPAVHPEPNTTRKSASFGPVGSRVNEKTMDDLIAELKRKTLTST